VTRLRACARSRFEGLGFEYVSFFGEELSVGDLRRASSEGSLFAAGRLLRVAEAEKAPAAARQELLALAEGSDETAMLVEIADHRSSLATRLEKSCTSFVCWDPFERDMYKWCDRLAGENGLSITGDASQMLVGYSSGNLSRLADAIERAAIFAAGSRLGRKELSGFLWASAEADAFDLVDSAMSGDWRKALGQCWKLISAGEEPVGLVALLFRQWLRADEARRVIRGGGGQGDLERIAGARGPAVRRLREAASSGTWGEPWAVSESFAEADAALKTGSDPYVVLAGLLRSLTGR
jgi:DNA polymerase III delta subunit